MRADDLTLLDDLKDQVCWSAAAGLDREWLVVLDLGEKVRRSLRLANPTLSFEQRTYEGSHAVVVEGSWRVDGPDEVIVSCLDSRHPTDRLNAGLAELVGKRLISAVAEPPAHDLVLTFEGGLVLRAFVLEALPAPARSVPEGARSPAPPPPPRTAWSAWTPTGMLKVGVHGRLGELGPSGEPPPHPGRPHLAVVDEDDEDDEAGSEGDG